MHWLWIIVPVVGPLYVYYVCKLAGAGWIAGVQLYIKRQKERR